MSNLIVMRKTARNKNEIKQTPENLILCVVFQRNILNKVYMTFLLL